MDKSNDFNAQQSEMEELDLEYQYSPSKWSKRMNSDAVIQAHISLATAASAKAKETIPYEMLRYGNGKNQLIDIFGTSLPNDSPLLVYIHGGYWQELERSISAYPVEPLYKKGIRVAVAGYDLAPDVTLDRIIEEMKELDYFISEWSTRTGSKDVWYAGHSAGAYLVATILKNRSESQLPYCPIRGMIFISGIYDLLPIADTYVNNELKLSRDEAVQKSLTKIDVKNFPESVFLTVVAEHDSDEFRRQSREFHEMLVRQNLTAEFLEIKGTDHFDVVEKLNDDQYELTEKFKNLISGE